MKNDHTQFYSQVMSLAFLLAESLRSVFSLKKNLPKYDEYIYYFGVFFPGRHVFPLDRHGSASFVVIHRPGASRNNTLVIKSLRDEESFRKRLDV